MKSYSELNLKLNAMVHQGTRLITDMAKLKNLVKSVLQEGDRRRNIVISGQLEKKDANVEEHYMQVFQGIDL